jgi:hypothetical protein
MPNAPPLLGSGRPFNRWRNYCTLLCANPPSSSAEHYGEDLTRDPVVRAVKSASALRLLKVSTGQWHGAIWTGQDTGVRWLVAAGLAKGGREDRDDVCEQLSVRFDCDRSMSFYRPTRIDGCCGGKRRPGPFAQRELDVQASVEQARHQFGSGGVGSFTLTHRTDGSRLADVGITVSHDTAFTRR